MEYMIEDLNSKLGETKPKIQKIKGDIGTMSLFDIYVNRSAVIRKLLMDIEKNEIKTTCLIMFLYNPAKPSLHQIACNSKVLHAVLCEQNTIVSNKKAFKYHSSFKDNLNPSVGQTFLCPTGSYISILNVCDGKNDCHAKPVDEVNCTCKLGSTIVDIKLCTKLCNLLNCTCSHLYRQNHLGICKIYWKKKHFYHPLLQYDCLKGNTSSFKCSEHKEIHYSLVNDLIPDCKNGLDEPFVADKIFFRKERTCEDQKMLECYPGHGRCYFPEHQCMYFLSIEDRCLIDL